MKCAMMRRMLLALTALGCLTVPALAQRGDDKTEDKEAKFPAPPKGFDARRDGIDRGKLETVEYDSTRRRTKGSAMSAVQAARLDLYLTVGDNRALAHSGNCCGGFPGAQTKSHTS